jgi:hypothetical protein
MQRPITGAFANGLLRDFGQIRATNAGINAHRRKFPLVPWLHGTTMGENRQPAAAHIVRLRSLMSIRTELLGRI